MDEIDAFDYADLRLEAVEFFLGLVDDLDHDEHWKERARMLIDVGWAALLEARRELASARHAIHNQLRAGRRR
jgi:hypothetical protein